MYLVGIIKTVNVVNVVNLVNVVNMVINMDITNENIIDLVDLKVAYLDFALDLFIVNYYVVAQETSAFVYNLDLYG